MHIPKNYFHDRLVLFLLSINTFLALLASMLILLRLGGAEDYIVQYRANVGINAFTTGSAGSFINFVVFGLFVLAFHWLLSMRIYHIRRHFSIAILGMGTLLLILTIIVTNALLLLN